MDAARPVGDAGRSTPDRSAARSGVRETAARWAALLLSAGRTRLELALLELDAARMHLERLWIGAAVTLFLALVACALLLTWLLLTVEPADRGTWAGALGLAFAAAAAAGGWRWWWLVRHRRPWLADSLQALRDDEAALRPASELATASRQDVQRPGASR